MTNVAPPPHREHRRRLAQSITVVAEPYRSASSVTFGSNLCRHCSHHVKIRTPALSACPKISDECSASCRERSILSFNKKTLGVIPGFRTVIGYGAGATIRASELHPLLIHSSSQPSQ
jgi:hypothetical protein